MLFKINKNALEPVSFLNLAQLGKLEKDLENLLSINMFDKLFEGNPLLVVFQERQWQPEPDIVALDKDGNSIIFELKRESAGSDALGQLFRYTQEVQKWNYQTLQQRLEAYQKDFAEQRTVDLSRGLQACHQETFGLIHPLELDEFNRHQKMVVIGSSADEKLIEHIHYWQSKGMDIDFIPYRIYEIGGENYFEFFAKPFDVRSNPAEMKGIMFDTNLRYYDKGTKDMLLASKVAAYGDIKELVRIFNKGDLVFFSHRYVGIVGAGRVKSTSLKEVEENEEMYYDVELLTPIPKDLDNPVGLSFSDVSNVLGKSFYWARTDKRPYLNKEESEILLQAVVERLQMTESSK